jgi:carbon-monoxide dehydrogenase large subunit
VRERLLDAIAAKIGVEKVGIRRRNLIGKSAMPYALGLDTLNTNIVYDSGDYALLLDTALRLADWTNLQQQLFKRRQNGEKVGAGVAMFVEKSGLGPSDTVKIEINLMVRSKSSPALRRSAKALKPRSRKSAQMRSG